MRRVPQENDVVAKCVAVGVPPSASMLVCACVCLACCSAACLLLPWYALEYPRLAASILESSSAAAAVEGGTGEASSLTLLKVLSAALSLAGGGKGGGVGGGGWSPLGDVSILTLNALCTFALNLSVFLVILHTSALTIRVAGVVKDWLVVLISALLFADTKLTPTNIFGYAVGEHSEHRPRLDITH